MDLSKQAFVNNGGDEKQFREQLAKGAVSATADAVKGCIRSFLDALNVDVLNATQTQLKNAQANCTNDAQDAFTRAGGSLQDFNAAKREGAAATVGDSMKSCVEAKIANRMCCCFSCLRVCECVCACAYILCTFDVVSASWFSYARAVTSNATDIQMKAFKKACEDNAKQLFLESGGDSKDFQQAKVKGAISNVKDDMEGCVTTALGNNTQPNDAAIKAAVKGCENQTKASFLGSGGNAEDFNKMREEANAKKVKDSLKTCMDGECEILFVLMRVFELYKK
jgi:hypothetical protein